MILKISLSPIDQRILCILLKMSVNGPVSYIYIYIYNLSYSTIVLYSRESNSPNIGRAPKSNVIT